MNGATITQGPTILVNPDALHTVDELRQALHAANGELIELSGRFHEMHRTADTATRTIAALITAQRRFGNELVAQMLRSIEDYSLTPDATESGRQH